MQSIVMRNEIEVTQKRDYWSSIYYALNPTERHRSDQSEREWLTAEVWLTALNWSLGLATNSATTLERINYKDGRDL